MISHNFTRSKRFSRFLTAYVHRVARIFATFSENDHSCRPTNSHEGIENFYSPECTVA